MNEETTVPVEETVPESIEPPATEIPETAPETTDGTVEAAEPVTEPPTTTAPATVVTDPTQETIFYEDLTAATEETTEAVVIVDVIETAATDLAHVNLFGSFLICGTLVGIKLLEKINGT